MSKAHERAMVNIKIIADSAGAERELYRLSRSQAPRAKQAMGLAVAWWHSQTIMRIPVSYERERGQLKKRTQPAVVERPDGIEGMITSGVHYAVWLAAGTRRIAGGRVMRWRHGQPTIRHWGAKDKGSSPTAELPIILPWQVGARDRFVEGVAKTWKR